MTFKNFPFLTLIIPISIYIIKVWKAQAKYSLPLCVSSFSSRLSCCLSSVLAYLQMKAPSTPQNMQTHKLNYL